MRKVCRPTPRQLKSETTIIERVEEEVMRQAEIERNTFETKIKLSLNLDAQASLHQMPLTISSSG